MLLYRKDARKLMAEIGESMLEDFGHKSRFIIDLLDQDDWSFVIKAHAMLEAAVTELVLEHLGETRLKEVVDRLPLSDGQIGKVVIAKHPVTNYDRITESPTIGFGAKNMKT